LNVLLINPPYPPEAPKSIFIPMGLSYLAAFLEKHGHQVNIIDYQVREFNQDQLVDEIAKIQPEIVGVTSATLTYKPALKIVRVVKKAFPNCLTVMGGSHVTVMDVKALEECQELDIVVRGEGEQTILEIVKAISNSRPSAFNEILGITFRRNKKIFRNPDKPFIQNLDELPFPAFERLELNKYRLFNKTYLPIITSRGCPFNCTFCLASKMLGKKFRARSPRNVVDEIERLISKFGADAITFYDDTFTFDLKRADEICQEIMRRKVDVSWDCRTRVDRVNRRLLEKMHRANCELIHFGVESGSQKMLNAMKKGTTVEQNARAIKWAKEAGILVAVSVIIGYPGETEETMDETIDFLRKTEPDYVYMCIPTPYPGTELYTILEDLGWKLSKDWNLYNEQTPVYDNPLLSFERIQEERRRFYNQFFSIPYILNKSLKRGFYSRIMARIAINYFLWRIKETILTFKPKK